MKYIIELEDEPIKELFADAGNYYRCKQRPFWFISEDTRGSLTPYTEPDRKAIEDAQEEVWNFARKIVLSAFLGGLTTNEIKDCFGNDKVFFDVLRDFSYQEAKAKYEAWKKEKDKIRVGDEIIYDSKIGVLLATETQSNYARIFIPHFPYTYAVTHEKLLKTGRHFDEVEELLKKMKEE